VIFARREALWPTIAFHGIKSSRGWDLLAKAKYVVHLHDRQRLPLDRIASAIADRHGAIQRLYEAATVLEQAESAGVFDSSDVFFRRKEFALVPLFAALGCEGIRRFLGLKSIRPSRDPIPTARVPALREALFWLYGSHATQKQPLVTNLNSHLPHLEEILQSRRGLAALRKSLSLTDALNAARGDTYVLFDALSRAERSLAEARTCLAAGYHGERHIQQTINSVHALAEHLRDGAMDSVSRRY
jgi:hypothetical protein